MMMPELSLSMKEILLRLANRGDRIERHNGHRFVNHRGEVDFHQYPAARSVYALARRGLLRFVDLRETKIPHWYVPSRAGLRSFYEITDAGRRAIGDRTFSVSHGPDTIAPCHRLLPPVRRSFVRSLTQSILADPKLRSALLDFGALTVAQGEGAGVPIIDDIRQIFEERDPIRLARARLAVRMMRTDTGGQP